MKKVIAFLFLVLFTAHVFACSTFLLSKNGRHVFGRNYDWITSAGMVCTNLKGLAKTSANNKPGEKFFPSNTTKRPTPFFFLKVLSVGM